MHTFVCVGPLEHAKQAALWSVLNGSVTVLEPPPRVDFADQFERMAYCYAGVVRHAAERGLRFTHFVRARPDLRWDARARAVAGFDETAVTLRARGLLYENATPSSPIATALGAHTLSRHHHHRPAFSFLDAHPPFTGMKTTKKERC